jgi:DNA topoisomerase-1
VTYTARLEDALDAVARGELTRLEMLKTFWADFAPQLSAAGQAVQQTAKSRRQSPAPTGETCPLCGGELLERHGAHGSFLGCSNYPDCRYTRGLEHQPVTLQPADRTGEHEP